MPSLLTDEERDALSDSIQKTGRSRERAPSRQPEPIPVALIADDQATEKVRPAAQRIAERWATELMRLISPASGAKVKVEVTDVVTSDAAEVCDELNHNWLAQVKPVRGCVLVAASGTMIPELAARVLGGKYDSSKIKNPTSATLRVFGKVGQQIAVGLVRALEVEQGGPVSTIPAPASAETWQPIADGSPLVMARLTISGDTEGVVRMIAPPDALLVARRLPRAPMAAPQQVRAALAEVPVAVSVELGSTTMRASQFARLEPGQVLSLDALIGDPLPVRVAGRLHGFGQAVLMGDVIAVEITDGSGTRQTKDVR